MNNLIDWIVHHLNTYYHSEKPKSIMQFKFVSLSNRLSYSITFAPDGMSLFDIGENCLIMKATYNDKLIVDMHNCMVYYDSINSDILEEYEFQDLVLNGSFTNRIQILKMLFNNSEFQDILSKSKIII